MTKFTFPYRGTYFSPATMADRSESFARLHERRYWSRALKVNDALVLIQILSDGQVKWHSDTSIDMLEIKQVLDALLYSVPFPSENLDFMPSETLSLFRQHSPLTHIRSTTLFEAVIKAVIRQVVSSRQAQKQIHAFSSQFGKQYLLGGIHYQLFPSAPDLSELSTEDIAKCGIGFKGKIISNIVKEFLCHDLEQRVLSVSPIEGLDILRSVKGIGDWTSRIIICDITGDWSLYPIDDIAVRTWTKKWFPNFSWPQNSKEFKAAWIEYTGSLVGPMTFYTLNISSSISSKQF